MADPALQDGLGLACLVWGGPRRRLSPPLREAGRAQACLGKILAHPSDSR